MPNSEAVKRRVRTKQPPTQVAAECVERVSTVLYGRESETVERQVEKFVTEPAFLRVNVGVTKNLGNYESLRVDVALTVPCYKEMVEETFEGVAEKVNALLTGEVERYLAEGIG